MASVSNVGNTSQNVFSNATTNSSAKKQQIDFLHMLMVQLKNQNPSQPYDNQQFAAQLATFSQLEQLTNIKELLSNQSDVIGLMAMSMENSALPGMIGKYANANSDTLSFDGLNPSEFSFKSDYGAVSGKVHITDNQGKIIKTMELSANQCKAGEQKIAWDGCDDAGNKLLPGKYKVAIELTENDGNISKPQIFTVGKIEAVRFKKEGTVLVIGGNEVKLTAVNDIRETM